MHDALRDYLNAVEHEYKTGIAIEHAYRPALERLLEAIEPGLNAVNDPKRSDIGAPDFIVLRDQTPIGFVEAKDIGVPLDRVEKSEQMQRYLGGFGNLILTDYLEFRWYVQGQRRLTARIAEVKGRAIRALPDQFDALAHLLREFAQAVVPTISTADELAQRMAASAHLIRDLIVGDLNSADPSRSLVNQRDAFARTLLPDIDNAQFADMYAQTIAYGLFAARVNFQGKPEHFSRRGAGEDIPPTNPFLRKLFTNIGLDLGERVTFLVDVLADLLARTDTDEILKHFGRATRQDDPVVHFYETFLQRYDPKLREQRGVYYTPEPVVGYIVRSVDTLLRERFGRFDGLADRDTLILDPATGTGTFLYFVIRHIYETAFAGQAGAWNGYVTQHLLRRLFGFELLMAPYAVAHMKLGLLLRDLGYAFGSRQRLGVYLTNTLEEATKTSEAMFAQYISDEANAAAAIKRDKPIMVVLGNPPYSGHSANKGDWIGKLVRDYYAVDGQPLGERNPKWLQDDYVKFIRFGQWRIDQTGSGVLAFITNNSYLDSVTFRGMRQQLMQTFSDIYILDLHGSSKKQETTPDGLPDENVFDIQQGVAIGIFVKEAGHAGPARVHHLDLWGRRQGKYDWLFDNDLSTTEWKAIEPLSPYYFFIPRNNDLKSEYEQGWKVTDIFPVNVLGFQSHRDFYAVDFDYQILHERMLETRSEVISDASLREKYGLKDNRDWQLRSARTALQELANWQSYLIECAYRPFDNRWCYFNEIAMDYPRRELKQHVLNRDNLCLNTMRQTKMSVWQHALVSQTPTPAPYVEIKDGASVFPLYLYPEDKADALFDVEQHTSEWPLSDKGRRPNLSKKFVQAMEAQLGLQFVTEGKGDLTATFGPEAVFAYAYAVFHSPGYRERYAEFLKIDFPRLPLASDTELFRALVGCGAALVDIHLMRSPALRRLITSYPVEDGSRVESGYPKYTESDRRVYINKTQYFEGVPPKAWAFYVGGYQVLDKWLKDRRGRALSYEDIMHYQRIVVALCETLRLMDEIDALIPGWPL